jgi:phosphatidylserine/phosphatidylglycerophosphate/cardiolipin synthase-like enzyme/uncharacterized membrane protein YdjX (TVP38/TMEM64 family)
MSYAPDQQDRADARRFLVEGDTCWRVVRANRAAALIDAAAYFQALRSSLLKARRSVFILGWELNSRTCFEGLERKSDRAPRDLGPFLRWLLRHNRKLRIRILLWDYSVFYAAQRELFPKLIFGWRKPRRVDIVLDSHLPLGASHHEKLVVIDDSIAFCGGIDLTTRRWDTPEHDPTNPRRCDPSHKPYTPFHDVQMVVDGDAAAALGQRARERWEHAGEEPLEPVSPAGGDAWPTGVAPDFVDVPVGISRTLGAEEHTREIREVERSLVAAIERAESFVYIENQYITARAAAEALLARMRSNPALRALVVTTREPGGWLEAETMGTGRQNFMAMFEEPHIRRRIAFMSPVVRAADAPSSALAQAQRVVRTGSGPERKAAKKAAEGDRPLPPSEPPPPEGSGPDDVSINVHAKVLVVDDALLHVGSANLNNRSMGFDTECDLGFEAVTPEHSAAIARIRNRLIAEHTGTDEAAVAAALQSSEPMEEILRRINSPGRWLEPLAREDVAPTAEIVVQLGDPERAVTVDRFVDEILGLKSRRRELRWAAIALAAVAAGALAWGVWKVLPGEGAAIVDRVSVAIEALRGEPWAIPVVLIVFMLGSLVAFPITVLIGTTILTFDPLPGFTAAALGTMLGAVVTFVVGRLLGRRALRKMFGERVDQLEHHLKGRGVIAVALIRKVPVAPFTIVNMLIGASGLHLREFVAGTALGMIPGIAAFTIVGDRLADVWRDPNPVNVSLVIGAVVIWIGVVLGMQRLVNRYSRRK